MSRRLLLQLHHVAESDALLRFGEGEDQALIFVGDEASFG